MLDVVQVALRNIFEPMAQGERDIYIRFLRTQFESDASECVETPSVEADGKPSKGGRRYFRKGARLPYYLKVIQSYDETKKGGYCFDGPFISEDALDTVTFGAPVLVGTNASPKKYALAKVDRHAELTFGGPTGEIINVKGVRLVCVSSDVQELIDALKAFGPLKS